MEGRRRHSRGRNNSSSRRDSTSRTPSRKSSKDLSTSIPIESKVDNDLEEACES